MVYNTVSPPCRVVDTRNAGARTGPILANQTRAFDLTTEAETDGQGGGPFPCPGLPSFHFQGWALNITVLGNGPYTTHGGLKQWPFTGPEPNASVINWTPDLNGAIANRIIATGCPWCADSIFIKNFGTNPTHVIIDVMGYFSGASVISATVTRFSGTLVPAAAATGATATGAACPAGTLLVGGDLEHPSTGAMAISAAGEARSMAIQGVQRHRRVGHRCAVLALRGSAHQIQLKPCAFVTTRNAEKRWHHSSADKKRRGAIHGPNVRHDGCVSTPASPFRRTGGDGRFALVVSVHWPPPDGPSRPCRHKGLLWAGFVRHVVRESALSCRSHGS
jgi:hypothetical protein